MAKDSLYVIAPIGVVQAKWDEYVSNGFENRGTVRYSLDGTKALLEELPEKFNMADAEGYQVLEFTEDEMITYLEEHKSEWEVDTLD